MKRIIIKSVTSIADHAWFFKHFPKANSALKGGWVFKGNSKNFWLYHRSKRSITFFLKYLVFIIYFSVNYFMVIKSRFPFTENIPKCSSRI